MLIYFSFISTCVRYLFSTACKHIVSRLVVRSLRSDAFNVVSKGFHCSTVPLAQFSSVVQSSSHRFWLLVRFHKNRKSRYI